MSPRKFPASTYRVQLNSDFGFADLERILPYLKRLGVSHVYLSPCFLARPGSQHGYDISNHHELNPELGAPEEFYRACRVAEGLGIERIFDMVPNHMGILGNRNAWWQDVLENGRASSFAQYFDIDWNFSLKAELHEKVLLPVLGCPYGEALESGQLKLILQDGQFSIHYFDQVFPISPCSLEPILSRRSVELAERLGEQHSDLLEYQSIITAVRNLPSRTEIIPERIVERNREKEVIRRRLSALVERNAEVALTLSTTLEDSNGRVGDPRSFDFLDALLAGQAYRLSDFRVAADEINYRRFFDINELAALCMERPEVFEDTHRLLLQLLRDGVVQGVRVDHVDGLYDPLQYLQRLQEAAQTPEGEPRYVIVEKILGYREQLPRSWPVAGATGYEMLAAVNALFVDSRNEKSWNRLYARWSEGTPAFSEVAYRSKQQIQLLALASEVHVLAQQLDRLSERNRRFRDFTATQLLSVLRDIIAAFPVYRSYVDDAGLTDVDRRSIEAAVNRARLKNPVVHPSVFDFVRDTLLLRRPEGSDEQYFEDQLSFVRKFQQVTSPVTAKGVEDTSFYIYNRFLSLNEVGSDPDIFGISREEFHRRMQVRQEEWPGSLSASATHDTKRGEDTRARLNVLSEIPEEFGKFVSRCEFINRRFVSALDGGVAPGRNTLFLFYQTLCGAWPLQLDTEGLGRFRERMQSYMQKAIHEAKQETSWINPNQAYDEAVRRYVDAALSSDNERFLSEVERFLPRIQDYGLWNGLSQLTVKLCAPGAPDTYRGCELWDFTLVDPDNRQPVDYDLRSWLLGELEGAFQHPQSEEWGLRLRDLVARRHDGKAKLFVLWRILELRKQRPALFERGDYRGLSVAGKRAEHVIAFLRTDGNDRCLVVVPRFFTSLLAGHDGLPCGEEIWGDTVIELPSHEGSSSLSDQLSGRMHPNAGRLRVGEVLAEFPVAVLV